VQDIPRLIDTVFRIERPRLIATLARMLRDASLAEDIAQDAMTQALIDWPKRGPPASPQAWLMATAKRRAIDHLRHVKMAEKKHLKLAGAEDDGGTAIAALEASIDDDVGDEVLSLIFTACHPALTPDARAALTLKLVCGLTSAEIARAFLVAEATMAQRIVRAKAALSRSGADYEIPRGAELERRLGSVLEVVYLIFNEGYAPTGGDAVLRADLAGEARRLGRMLAARLPNDVEALSLLALMDLQASRFAARVDADGNLVALPEQDRSRWDRLLIHQGLTSLERAQALASKPGFYRLQAEIAACHARARRWEDTDWPKIETTYAALLALNPSPVVALNHAISVGMARGPAVALELIDGMDGLKDLEAYAPLHAARGDALFRLERWREAERAFEIAGRLASNNRERDFLAARQAQCRKQAGTS
jgi:RNA polymerase sigma factor (sigma-70 family)